MIELKVGQQTEKPPGLRPVKLATCDNCCYIIHTTYCQKYMWRVNEMMVCDKYEGPYA